MSRLFGVSKSIIVLYQWCRNGGGSSGWRPLINPRCACAARVTLYSSKVHEAASLQAACPDLSPHSESMSVMLQ